MSRINKAAYLTIDDGPVEDMSAKVDFLESKGIKAIWFCTGSQMQSYKNRAVYAVQKGHIIGNHGYSHSNFSEIDEKEIQLEITKTDECIDQIYFHAGIKRPFKVFRFPYLNNGGSSEYLETDWNNRKVKWIQTFLHDLGYRQPCFEQICYSWYKTAGLDRCLNVDCTYDTFDWCLQENQEMFGYHDLESVLMRIDEDVPEGGRGLNNGLSNEIIMMHAWIPFDAFTAIISKILKKGIVFRNL